MYYGLFNVVSFGLSLKMQFLAILGCDWLKCVTDCLRNAVYQLCSVLEPALIGRGVFSIVSNYQSINSSLNPIDGSAT